MKRTLIFTALILVPLLSFARGLQREVLFTMNEHEYIYDNEYFSTNSFDGYRYSCMLYDSVRQEFCLMWNGVRKNVTDYHEWYYVDLNDFDNSIYISSTDAGRYLHMGRKTWGPYYNVWLEGEGNVLNEFYFWKYKDDTVGYFHDYDGVVRKIKEERFLYRSPNKVHTAELSKNSRQLRIDGNTYILPFPTDDKFHSNDGLYLLNDGTCYYESEWHSFDGYYSRYYVIIKDNVVSFCSGFYDQLRNEDTTGLGMWPEGEGNYYFWPNWVHDEQSDSWFYSFEFDLADKEKKHVFHADWKQKGAMIDGKRYGKTCPFSAFYDENKNAFVWVAQEGQQVVRYSFTL